MQTRAAARRAAEAAATTGGSIVAVTASLALHQSESTNDTATPVSNLKQGGKATASSKRKHAPKKQVQPLKGGWVLPHGMGVALAGVTTSSSAQKFAPTLPTSPVKSPPVGADGLGYGDSSSDPARSTSRNSISKATKQTRISLRITKAGIKPEKDSHNYQEPTVKLEDSASGDAGFLIKQEDRRPAKRPRTAPLQDGITACIATEENGASILTQVKTDEEESTIIKTTRKVLIIKGIAIKNNVVAKTLDKIVVDATQVLDPNYRITIKRGKDNPYGLTPGFSPYPYRRVPTPEACEEVHRILTELHGEVKQPEKMPAASLEIAGCGEVPCVLDALLRTLISGNTLMAAADAAIKNLVQHYGTRQEGTGAGSINWEKVRLSPHQELVQVIRVAGNGPKKGQHIKKILDMVYEENLRRAKNQAAGAPEKVDTVQDLLSLDHMHSMSKDDAILKFLSYPGIGIKTAACVTLFCLRMPCFAVDTHVHKFCRWLGWIPEKADPDNCFKHGEHMVPDHLKYSLHQLFIRHGQQCFKCRKATKPGTKDWNEAPECPLEHLLDRSKDEAGSAVKSEKRKRKREDPREEEEEEEEEEDGESPEDMSDAEDAQTSGSEEEAAEDGEGDGEDEDN